MKRCWIILFSFLLVGALYAQRLPDNWEEVTSSPALSYHFYAKLENSFHKKYSVLQNQWQAALFLGRELRPTEETLRTLKKQIRNGHLHRATVLSFAVQGTDAPGTAYLYLLDAEDENSEKKMRSFPPDTPLAVLLDALFAPLEASPDLYTALIINGGGNGINIRYADTKFLLLSDLDRPLAAYRLHVDVLDLQACRMGSAFGIKQLVQNDRIHYAIVSSNLRRGSREKMYYRLLNHFDKYPREAALAAHREFAEVIDFSSDKLTHNSIVLDLSVLREPLQTWALTPSSILLEAGWHSFRDFLLSQHTGVANNLAAALEKSVLAQWCYSAKTHQLYQNNIPSDTYCIDGINVNREMLPAFWP